MIEKLAAAKPDMILQYLGHQAIDSGADVSQ
jgi:hypothetical protein